MPRTEDLCPETGRARLCYDRARALLDHYTSPSDGQPGWDLRQFGHSAATTLGEKARRSSSSWPRRGTAMNRSGFDVPCDVPWVWWSRDAGHLLIQ